MIAERHVVHSWKDGVDGQVDSDVTQLEDEIGQESQPEW